MTRNGQLLCGVVLDQIGCVIDVLTLSGSWAWGSWSWRYPLLDTAPAKGARADELGRGVLCASDHSHLNYSSVQVAPENLN